MFLIYLAMALAIPAAAGLAYQEGWKQGHAAAWPELQRNNAKMKLAISDLLEYYWLSCEETVYEFGDLPKMEIPVSKPMAGIQNAIYQYEEPSHA